MLTIAVLFLGPKHHIFIIAYLTTNYGSTVAIVITSLTCQNNDYIPEKNDGVAESNEAENITASKLSQRAEIISPAGQI